MYMYFDYYLGGSTTRTVYPDEPFPSVPGKCLNVIRDCSSRDQSIIRTYDGSCNNLTPDGKNWGAIEMPLRRRLPPDYADRTYVYSHKCL